MQKIFCLFLYLSFLYLRPNFRYSSLRSVRLSWNRIEINLQLTAKFRSRSTTDQYTCPNGRLTENVFKRISANANLNSHPNSNPNSNPKPKAQIPFRENEMTSFFRQVSRYLQLQFRFGFGIRPIDCFAPTCEKALTVF